MTREIVLLSPENHAALESALAMPVAGSSAAEQEPVKLLVAGSIPAPSAIALEPAVIETARAGDLNLVLSTWGRAAEDIFGVTTLGFLHAFAPIQAKLIKRSRVLVALRGERVDGVIVFEQPTEDMCVAPRRYGESSYKVGPRSELGNRAMRAEAAGVLHWIWSRKHREGIGRQLLTAAGLSKPIVTTWTSDLRHIGLADAPYMPFWLRTT